ncbi:hypothetical protein J3Q64DRAFT_1745807 [Phycomyces blakesleeanus]|uniref:DDE Tnp4 domain-containing protein n=1 Tax=Phycomyces blakesleeanus TaxID=4837 RepID=A0ABR3AXK4_PHYBL
MTTKNIEHSKDAAIRTVDISTKLLGFVIRRHIFASFANLCRIKHFYVQCICTTITLFHNCLGS